MWNVEFNRPEWSDQWLCPQPDGFPQQPAIGSDGAGLAIGNAIPPVISRSTGVDAGVAPISTPARWHNSPQV